MMKVNKFIELLIKYEKVPTLYKLGTFLNKYDGKYLLSDCSGLIKGILWGYPDNGNYQGGSIPDINADTMMLHCTKVSTDFSNLPVGALVHMKGHIGVHIGNGVCIESSPKWENGIQKTFITGSGFSNKDKLNSRKWQNWGLFRYIDYTTETPQPTKSITDIAYEVINGVWGNGSERKERLTQSGYNYETVQAEVNRIVNNKQLQSVSIIAQQVINGDWGNGSERKERLTKAGYDYNAVQKEVNRLLK